MTARRCSLRGSLVLALFVGCSITSVVADAAHPEQIARGEKLFLHQWSMGDELSPLGDGLGPLHNERSCAACHMQGGVGGAGPADKDVDLISVTVPGSKGAKGRRTRIKAAQLLSQVHPAFADDRGNLVTNMVLHRFGGVDYEVWRYKFMAGEYWENAADDGTGPKKRKTSEAKRFDAKKGSGGVTELGEMEGIVFAMSRRSTPALVGAGLIDSISEETLRQVGIENKTRGAKVRGRVPISNQGRAGRFGWRGQTNTLEQFVLTACAHELGLNLKDHQQPVSPVARHYKIDDFDMDDHQCDDLVEYVKNLPRPVQIVPDNVQDRLLVESGEQIFSNVGCADCHRPKLGEVTGIYSDMLLHDMGSSLSDPVPSIPATSTRVVQSGGGGYSGGSSDIEEFVSPGAMALARQEWRTPPLWGVRDSAPYLHDGRAATLEQAIALHGGEAEYSVEQYFAMSAGHRARLLAFLNTLAAPVETTSLASK